MGSSRVRADTLAAARRGDEVDQFLDPAEQLSFQVGVITAGAQPSARSTPSFHGVPRGTVGQPLMPSVAGLTACQMSTNGCPATSTYGEVTAAAMRCSLDPGTRWSTRTPSR